MADEPSPEFPEPRLPQVWERIGVAIEQIEREIDGVHVEGNDIEVNDAYGGGERITARVTLVVNDDVFDD